MSLNSKTVRVPIQGGIGMGHLLKPDPWLSDIISRLPDTESGLFLDIGVNIGQTLLKVKTSSKPLDYLGFEPVPACVAYVGELIKQNGFTGVTVVPAAIGEKLGVLEIEMDLERPTDAAATLVKGFQGGRLSATQPVCVLDAERVSGQVDERKVQLIKIDVEGGELDVLKALRATIEENRSPIVVEVLPHYGGENPERFARQREIESLIREWNYELFEILKSDTFRFKGIARTEEFGTHSDVNRSDYFLIPAERRELSTLWS